MAPICFFVFAASSLLGLASAVALPVQTPTPVSGTSTINVLLAPNGSEAIDGCLDFKGQFVPTGSSCDTFTAQADGSVSSSRGPCGFFTGGGVTVFVCASTITKTTPLFEVSAEPAGQLFFGSAPYHTYLYSQNPNSGGERTEYALQKEDVSPLIRVAMAWAKDD